MKKRIIIVLGILIAAGGIGTGVWYHFKGNGQSGTGDSIVYVSKVSVITGSETTANSNCFFTTFQINFCFFTVCTNSALFFVRVNIFRICSTASSDFIPLRAFRIM